MKTQRLVQSDCKQERKLRGCNSKEEKVFTL